jgi:hypothetical protein
MEPDTARPITMMQPQLHALIGVREAGLILDGEAVGTARDFSQVILQIKARNG